jgi:hypothetical protein
MYFLLFFMYHRLMSLPALRRSVTSSLSGRSRWRYNARGTHFLMHGLCDNIEGVFVWQCALTKLPLSKIGYTQWANKPAERDAAVRFSQPNPLPTPLTNPSHRSSRRSVQQAPSSSPRRTSPRCSLPLRASTPSGAARPIPGRPHTPRAARARG